MKKSYLIHKLLQAGLSIKAINGLLEILGAVILLGMKSVDLHHFVELVFQHELWQDSSDFLASYFIPTAHHIVDVKVWAAVYLLIHGIIKIGLWIAVWRNKLWAYPLAGAILIVVVVYQLLRLTHHFSSISTILTFIDLSIIVLLKLEYTRICETKT